MRSLITKSEIHNLARLPALDVGGVFSVFEVFEEPDLHHVIRGTSSSIDVLHSHAVKHSAELYRTFATHDLHFFNSVSESLKAQNV
jgi:hypothetical protein